MLALSRQRATSNRTFRSRRGFRALSLTAEAKRIRTGEQSLASTSDDELQGHAVELREQQRRNDGADPIQYAPLVAEAVFRIHGFRLHDVQLQAIVAGCRGAIVEMQTGEGKTVVTGSTAACRASVVSGVHVATTNSYLAARDYESMKPVFELLGFTSDLLPEQNSPTATRKAYEAAITYGPGYQFGFDFLRDQVRLRANRQSRLGARTLASIRGRHLNEELVQPQQLHVALIDEADSVMIDEAMTPLVISGGQRERENPVPFRLARKLAAEMKRGTDYKIIEREKRIDLKPEAERRCHDAIADKGFRLARPWKQYIQNALRAEFLMARDVDYVVRDGEIQIVDQSTGRIFSDRTWQDGLHQAVEAREDVTILTSAGSLARVTRQYYLGLYESLSGLTGTAATAAREFKSVYGVGVVTIPTNLKCKRQLLRPRFFRDQQAKLDAIAQVVQQKSKTGQPVLIGTRTIRESQLVEVALKQRKLNPVVLNGMQDESEADIISRSGQFGALTIATNMAGRGTDIKLDAQAIAAGGLHVIAFSPNESRRVDRQLVGRSARQGNPGSARFYISADDEVVTTHAPALARTIAGASASTGESRRRFDKQIAAMQNEIEQRRFKNRQDMIRHDHWMNQVRSAIEKE